MSNPETDELNGADTIERVIERIQTSSNIADLRDAVRALKALSRTYRVEVGAQGMQVLTDVLSRETTDTETIEYALDTLYNIVSLEDQSNENENTSATNETVNIGEQFTEIFIKSPENVQVVLKLIEEYNFKVRWSAVKLLTELIRNRAKNIQDVILTSPMAFSKLMDLLSDSREIIRNDALLLLINLTKGNTNIQKIIAFENGFERLFEVIQNEGCLRGGIVVEDCLTLLLNLLKNNASNQQFFKESSYIQRLAQVVVLEDIGQITWTPQLITNTYLLLQTIRTLVHTNNIKINISSCQKTIRNCGLLDALCNILMENGIPANILTETINTVAEIIRGDKDNQEYFYSLMAPCNPPQSALVILLMSMINDKQPLELRCAVLYCLQCFLYQNENGQRKVVDTLIPNDASVSSVTIGQLLCGGILSNETLANWLSSVALMHVLIENLSPREQLLRVLLAKTDNNPPITLLQKCIQLLQGTHDTQGKMGILMLLCAWNSQSKRVVKAFLTIPGSTEYIMSQIVGNEHSEDDFLVQGLCAFLLGNCIEYCDNSIPGCHREDLFQSLKNRIGLETFALKIGEVSKHSSYSIASKSPSVQVKSSKELLLDYSFCKLFKNTESVILNTLMQIENRGSSQGHNIVSDSEVVHQYQNIIRDQDRKIQELQETIGENEKRNRQLQTELSDLKVNHSKLYDQNMLYKAQLNVVKSLQEAPEQETSVRTTVDKSQYRTENGQSSHANNIDGRRDGAKDGNAENEQEDLLELLFHQETLIRKYRKRLKMLGQAISDDEN